MRTTTASNRAVACALALAGVITIAPRAGSAGAGDVNVEDALARARAAADALGGELMATLLRELQQGGPAGAVRVCSVRAQEIAAAHSADDLVVRRVSRRARNPADVPDDYELGKLEEMEAALRQGELPDELYEEVGEPAARQLRYLRPITVRTTCLACHGDPEAIGPEVRALLAERYPDDPATGYRAGDLRGAVSVTVRLAGP